MEKCKTLGEETFFEYSYLNNILKISFGFSTNNITTVDISNSLIFDVIKRVNDLKLNDVEHSRMVGYYSLTHWLNCPQTQYCPYIAKLVLDVFPNKLIDNIVNSFVNQNLSEHK